MLRAVFRARFPCRIGVKRVYNFQQPSSLAQHALVRSRHPSSRSFQTTKKSSESSVRVYPATFLIVSLFAAFYATWELHWFENINITSIRDPYAFSQFTLVAKQNISSSCAIFVLHPSSSRHSALASTFDSFWDQCAIWSIEIKQPQLQVARAYTPLPPIDEMRPSDEIRLLVRKEPEGEVSRYLHSLPINAKVEIRGGFVETTLPEHYNDVIFVAGGTAIAPALQVAYGLQRRLRKRKDAVDNSPTGKMLASMRIMWANRRREDCSETETSDTAAGGILHQFQQMKSEAVDGSALQLSLSTFVDEEHSFIQASDLAAALDRQKETGLKNPIAIFFNGPGGFMDYIGGQSSGSDLPSTNGQAVAGHARNRIGGLLAQLDLRDRDVMIQRLQ